MAKADLLSAVAAQGAIETISPEHAELLSRGSRDRKAANEILRDPAERAALPNRCPQIEFNTEGLDEQGVVCVELSQQGAPRLHLPKAMPQRPGTANAVPRRTILCFGSSGNELEE